MDDPPSQVLAVFFSGIGLIDGLFFLAIGVLLFVSAIVSASEVAFFSMTAQDIDNCKARNDSRGLSIVELLSSPRLLLATILIVNNFVNVAVVTISTFLMWKFAGTQHPEEVIVAIVTISITFAITFFGEIVPKVYATKHNVSFARAVAAFWKILIIFCKPVSLVLLKISHVVERRFEKRGYHTTVDELNHALDIATRNDQTTKDEKEILKGIVNFGTLTVKQIMCTRIDIAAVDIESDFHELMDYINKLGFSRLPVYRETIDKIEGILYIKDLLPYTNESEHFEWQKLLRAGFFVPETKKIDSLLKDFQAKRVHMAIVVDEYGGTSGLSTLEDVIEEIIGEINDEFDDEEIKHQRITHNTFVFEGKVSLHDLCKAMDIPEDSFDAVREESESLGGLILELNHQLPKSGEQIVFNSFTFIVESVDRRRIKRVRIIKNTE